MGMAGDVTGIAGVALGGTSLGWNIVSWRRSGPVVAVSATNSFPVFGNKMGEHYVSVEAINKGRAPVTIVSWGIGMPGNHNLVQTEHIPWATQLPHRLEQGAQASFVMEADEIRRCAAENGIRFREMRPWVKLGNGQKISCKGVPLA